MTARRSLSEIRAQAMRAARGAGCPWGMAEEAGLAVRVLESHGLPGVAALARLLSGARACACTGDTQGPACGLAQMAALSDAMPQGARDMGLVAAPLLLAAPCLMSGGVWRLSWEGGALAGRASGVTPQGQPCPDCAEVTLIPPRPNVLPAAGAQGDLGSRPIADADWQALGALAARTYVPETAASRAVGAGPTGPDED